MANRTSARKKQTKTMTVNYSRASSNAGDKVTLAVSDSAISRTVRTISPETQRLVRPRKIKMPTVMNPECVFMSKTSKNLMQRVKINLTKVCEVD